MLNTFMPWDDFTWSARCLHDDQLEQQRNETLQIMHALLYGGSGSDEDPGVLMWQGHERALLAYQQAVCHEWSSVRGYPDDCWDKTRLIFLDVCVDPMATPLIPPVWMGNLDLHISHQSALLRINETHYRRHFPGIKTDHWFVWPVTKENN
jgi:hypothetical protein